MKAYMAEATFRCLTRIAEALFPSSYWVASPLDPSVRLQALYAGKKNLVGAYLMKRHRLDVLRQLERD